MLEKWENWYSKQKNNLCYWAMVILLVDAALAVYGAIRFAHTGLCRNYMEIGSMLQPCTTLEFMSHGFRWMSFSTAALFIPAALVMVIGTYMVDQVFAKKTDGGK